MQDKPPGGKVAIVTGAGSPIGLGRAMTLGLVRAGARVAMLDINKDWLEQSANDVREVGGDDCVLTLVADVSDPDSAAEAVRRTIAELGGLHVLINNAGIQGKDFAVRGTNAWETSPEGWSKAVAINLSGPYFMARAAVGHMVSQKWGRIIGVTTSLATMWSAGRSPYGPSKAGHEALVAIMARELEGTGVTANVLVPGAVVDTNILGESFEYDRATFMQPEVMEAPAVWLASEESKETTGRRFIARLWDESLPIEQRLEKAGAPAAWPQLGGYAITPWR